ncbi:hypothetical protein ACFL4T_02920 [candidate division KSB1 bacterium]
MKRVTLITTFILSFLFYCSSENKNERMETTNILSDILTLECSFGDKDELEGDFLLVKPKGVVINRDGDILILDDNKLKLFSGSGKPKKIYGGKGQGPGEFVNAKDIKISNKYFITILDQNSMHLLDRNFEFIQKEIFPKSNLEKNIKDVLGLTRTWLESVIFLDRNTKFIHSRGVNDNQDFSIHPFYFIGVSKKNNLLQIANHTTSHIYASSERGLVAILILDFLGQLLWDYSYTGDIITVSTDKDNILNDNYGEYKVNIFSIATEATSEILKKYERIRIGKMQTILWDGINSNDYPDPLKMDTYKEKLNKICEKEKYNKSIQALKTDREYIFAFTYKTNNKGEIYTDIFEIRQRTYVKSVYFSKIPDIIRNGYAYWLFRGSKNEYPRVEKYRINPEVYKK